ncbi:Nn.00g009000.m01.CDS01 [Neocucurbitaria sp. VM-36]
MSSSDQKLSASQGGSESDSTPEPPRKKLRFSTHMGPQVESRPIAIRIGGEDNEFYIHEKLLSSASTFFDNVLKEGWKEGHDRIVRLPDVAPSIFKVWMKWLYTGRLFVKEPGDDVTVCSSYTCTHESSRLYNCYALGEFLQDLDFKDATVDAMIDKMVERKGVPITLADHIYSHSNKDSKHRKLAIDCFIRLWPRGGWTSLTEEDEDRGTFQPRQFLCDVLIEIGPDLEKGVKRVNVEEFFDSSNTCKYHEHGSEKPCYKSKPAFRF